ncbi:unnamed protein product, partial [Brassica oleracea]
MKTRHWFLLLLILTLTVFGSVEAQTQAGFISLDCGLVPTTTTYTEKSTNITYKSDADYVDSGLVGKINNAYMTQLQQQTWSLRSFRDGQRNCYNLFDLTANIKYLIRATFMYGNYDVLNQLPSCDLRVGANKWFSIKITGVTNSSSYEIFHVVTQDDLQVCLVKTGPTTPFISSLELRPLNNNSYNTQSGSLMLFARIYFPSDPSSFVRYDEDIHDRGWTALTDNETTLISTDLPIDISSVYDMPQAVMKTVVIPANGSNTCYMRPPKISVSTIFNPSAVSSSNGKFSFTFTMTGNSTLPPLINAAEIYTVLDVTQLGTDNDEATISLREEEEKDGRRRNMGERRKGEFEGRLCVIQRILKKGSTRKTRQERGNLNASGLTGTITSDISKLTQLKELDLSSNDLSGEIPAFFADMKFFFSQPFLICSLLFLFCSETFSVFLLIQRNLSGNPKLNLTVPESLQEREKSKKVPVLAIAVPVVGVFALVVILAIFFIVRKKRPRSNAGIPPSVTTSLVKSETRPSNPSIITKDRRITLNELVLRMTNNFQRVLGKGGFGTVYHGNLDDAQVAVKMLSHSSAQGYKEFKAEVELLLRVHHRHLVGLVGYCDDGDNLALIYEYMANGDLRENMSGKRGGNVLTWENRMQIAVEAAQGLEYLHNGCRPPMVHRDVKTTNILLNDRSGAKLADFGLSRSFSIDGECHVSTVVAGTPGYLDPEYYRTNWLSEKSDVYSFRVVLLEIVTNQPVIDKTRERPHINEWVGFMLTKGDIRSIVDKLALGCVQGRKDWSMSGFSSGCVNPSSNQRPTMVQVVMELNECVALEIARRQGSQEMYSMGSVVTLVSLLLQSLPREPDNLKIYSDFAHLPGFTSSFGKFSNRENHIYFPPPLWLNPRRVQPTTTSEGPPLLPEDHIMKANLTLAGENRACSFLPTLGPFYLRYPLIRHLHHQVSELSTPDSMASRFSTAEKGPRHPYHVNDDRRIRHFKPSVDRDFRNDRRAVYADYRRRP